jgi:peptide/nickel transport system permease protein
MVIYTINRIIQLIPVLLILSIIVFSFVHLLPGDVIDVLAGEEDIQDPEVRAALEKEFGLDKPIYIQYLVWLGNV